ncbi:MAG TPA: hypothetical protein VG711_12070 [Phycisphaerales bacterium]|nr:hypothetical protein [Phycisphaerales bacterium]
MRRNIAIYGGFSGTETDLSERDVVNNVTTLSGNINLSNTNADNSYHVVTCKKTGSLNAGNYIDHSARLDGFTIQKGNADGSDDDTFGAGLMIYRSGPIVVNCIFRENDAEVAAGAIWVYDEDSDTTDFADPELVNCTFFGNHADEAGGALYNQKDNVNLTNCVFTGNTATYGGGAIINDEVEDEATLTLTNCTLALNVADDGSSVTTFGGGFINAGTMVVHNSVIWNNDADTDDQIRNTSSLTITYSDVEGGFSGTGNVNTSPHFVDENGPDMTPGTDDDNVRLEDDSPLINAALSASLPDDVADLDGDSNTGEVLPFDRDYVTRQLCTVDMGAYENYHYVDPCAADLNDDGSVDIDDLTAVILAWGSCSCPADFVCGDGQVNIDELTAIILNWGRGCSEMMMFGEGEIPPLPTVTDVLYTLPENFEATEEIIQALLNAGLEP